MQPALQGGLYIVATPIGNLGDFSARAQNVLRQCHTILCEDTRETVKLLKHYDIKNHLIGYHRFNERKKLDTVIDLLHQGHSIALVSDSGTPAISDPGNRLVASCHEQQINVYAVAGCCAVSAAVSASGLAERGFTFTGFLPAKSSERQKLLCNFRGSQLALVCFETSHRILAAMDDLLTVFGADKRICLARELTKRFETVKLAQLESLRLWLRDNPEQQKGEMVLVIEGDSSVVTNDEWDLAGMCDACVHLGISARQTSQLMAKITGLSRRDCYQVYLERLAKTQT